MVQLYGLMLILLSYKCCRGNGPVRCGGTSPPHPHPDRQQNLPSPTPRDAPPWAVRDKYSTPKTDKNAPQSYPAPSGEEERRELVVLPLDESTDEHAAADAEIRTGDGFQAGRGSAVRFHRMGVEGEEQGEFVGREGALRGDFCRVASFVAIIQSVGRKTAPSQATLFTA